MGDGPQPYYEDDFVRLFVGDCRDVRAWLDADVLVTDPPYGVAYVSNQSRYGSTEPIDGDDTPELRDDVLGMWGDRPALVFGKWTIDRPTATRQRLIWDKGDSPGSGDITMPWGPGEEEVYVLGDGFTGRRRTNVLRHQMLGSMAKDRPNHPTPKPVGLMLDLVSYCPPGVIADPFAGSGPTLRAAKMLGRRAIGVEKRSDYAAEAAAFLAQETMVFTPPEPAPIVEQDSLL